MKLKTLTVAAVATAALAVPASAGAATLIGSGSTAAQPSLLALFMQQCVAVGRHGGQVCQERPELDSLQRASLLHAEQRPQGDQAQPRSVQRAGGEEAALPAHALHLAGPPYAQLEQQGRPLRR